MIQPKNLKQDPLQAISNAGCLAVASAVFHQRSLFSGPLSTERNPGDSDLCLVNLHPQKFRQSHFSGAFRAQENLIEHDAPRQALIPLNRVVMIVGRVESNVIHENVATVLDPLWCIRTEDHTPNRKAQGDQLRR